MAERRIEKILKTKKILSKDNKPITLYFYEITGGDKVKTPQLFNIGDRVEAWFSNEWDEVRIRRYRGGNMHDSWTSDKYSEEEPNE